MINFERLDAAITYGFEHPDEFEMHNWFEQNSCGTTARLAGTVAVQAGWRPLFLENPRVTDMVENGTETRDVSDLAAELLGLDESESDSLFYIPSAIDGVIRQRNRLAARAGVPERSWAVQEEQR